MPRMHAETMRALAAKKQPKRRGDIAQLVNR
jgi:hypothetical protein